MAHTTLSAQSPSKNYVQTKTFLDNAGTTFLRHIDYYDELGVVAETVDVGGNTSQTPVVTRTEYNKQLKPSRHWAPVPSTGLGYLGHVYDKTQNTYGTSLAYTTNDYDDFQELSSTWKPGDAWEERPATMVRRVVPSGVVRKYSVDASGNLCDDGTYPYGLLMSTTTTDEDGRSVTVYTNMHGNTVLERRDEDNDTYYVYDRYGRLAYVLPPMCQQCSTSELPKYWYKYTYDDRGRCTEKQLPGCDPVKYWYDEANRLQSEQDGHLRSQSLYRNYSYDAIGRLTLQTISSTRGEATESNARAVEVKNYYDDYTCKQDFASLYSVWADSIFSRQPLQAVAKGKLTASLSTTSDGKKCFEMYHYDERGRVAYKLSAYSDSWLKAVHTSYNFVGDVASCMESVYKHIEYPKYLLARRITRNTYYPGTRLLESTTVTHTDKNRNTTSQVISHPIYDVFGNVTANDRPGTAADMAYDYDKLHGWLKGISSPCGFSEQLQRETAANAQFSGNIGSMQWRNTSNGELHHYDYTYDALGRLTDALYSSSGNETAGRYDEQVTYNSNGSITSLQRNGMKNDGTFGAIDDLTVTYDGNRLMKVTDDAEALNYNGALDFDDGDDADCEYQYDSNGALTYDGNRGITSISYDYGHHPSSIISRTKRKGIYNIYTPDGRKLSSQHVAYVPNGNGGNRRISSMDLYVDGLILRGGKPLMWQFDGGYVDLDDNGSPTGWNYYVTDHLGSTRMVVSSDNTVRETISYYPFGSEMTMQDPALMTGDFQHPYRFTGKELDRLNGLNMYDFGARWYDVAGVPMWTSVDPLAEKYYNVSPYVYCENNPLRFIDPDGREMGLPEEMLFGIRHPLVASRIGTVITGHNVINISTNATRFATREMILYGSMPKEQEERGSENGAFRHALWQAQITSEFGTSIAKQAGDAHEDNPNIDMNQTFYTNINEADKSADLHNNIIGRTIGESVKGAKMNVTAKAVLNIFINEGLYQAQKVKGGYQVVRVKLDSSKGNELMKIFNQLDENGMYPSDRLKPENDKIRRYEALQNSLN
ncbi:MAG: RHS repeat-associated core domain-containing protein [Prevotella sp.]|nr:RHS repeat-associated core domain-containing protein [Prevotella sp.]